MSRFLVAVTGLWLVGCSGGTGGLPGGDPCDDAPDGTACQTVCADRAECRSGECVVVSPAECPSSTEPCQRPVCTAQGCGFEPLADGTACDDGNACTEGDACSAGACGGRPVECEAGTCQVAACDPAIGCQVFAADDGTRCSDGDRCTIADRCIEGQCVPTRVKQCERTQCQLSNQCDPRSGDCVPVDVPEGTICDDENVCTSGDRCVAGACEPTGVIDRGDFCEDGICFTEVSERAGVRYEGTNISYDHGAAVAAADFDGDGFVDLMLAQEMTPPAMYLNNGDFTFRDASEAANFPEIDYFRTTFQGLAVGDYDNDGDVDAIHFHEGENRLYRNRGNATFDEVGAEAGIQNLLWSVGGAFVDLDLDGDLDLVVGNYLDPPSFFPNHNPQINAVYRNDGDGTFTRLEDAAGMNDDPAGSTLVITAVDFDEDGRPDIIECNDFGQTVTENRWYRNVTEPGGDISLEDVAPQLGADLRMFCMATAPGDFDRDLDLDYYHTNIGGHALLRNDGGSFQDVAVEVGADVTQEVCQPHLLSTGWAAAFRDFDSDGWLDLFSASGYILTDPDLANALEAENKLLRNRGSPPWFDDVSFTAGVATGAESRGAAFADLDNDGDEDMVVANIVGPYLVYRNDSPQGSWLRLRLEGTTSNRSGYHARITVEDDLGAKQLRESTPYAAYQSAPDSQIHFGLGGATKVDHLQVRWPSGLVQERYDVPVDQALRMLEPRFRVDVAQDGSDVTFTVEFVQQMSELRVEVVSDPSSNQTFEPTGDAFLRGDTLSLTNRFRWGPADEEPFVVRFGTGPELTEVRIDKPSPPGD